LERADSLALDPHTWLFQPYEIGCVVVRERRMRLKPRRGILNTWVPEDVQKKKSIASITAFNYRQFSGVEVVGCGRSPSHHLRRCCRNHPTYGGMNRVTRRYAVLRLRLTLREVPLQPVRHFLRPAESNAVTAINLIGGDSQAFFHDSAHPVGGKEAIVAT
jgi:hypothetical protein